jgi:hypothetical protein
MKIFDIHLNGGHVVKFKANSENVTKFLEEVYAAKDNGYRFIISETGNVSIVIDHIVCVQDRSREREMFSKLASELDKPFKPWREQK